MLKKDFFNWSMAALVLMSVLESASIPAMSSHSANPLNIPHYSHSIVAGGLLDMS